MKKFEYQMDFDCLPNELNALGAEGWELVAVVIEECEGGSQPVFYFKREIPK